MELIRYPPAAAPVLWLGLEAADADEAMDGDDVVVPPVEPEAGLAAA